MTAKETVLHYFPGAYIQMTAFYYEIWNSSDLNVMIGEDFPEEKAWEDAKKWIESLPEDQKPKTK